MLRYPYLDNTYLVEAARRQQDYIDHLVVLTHGLRVELADRDATIAELRKELGL